jgi:hypothetical protein
LADNRSPESRRIVVVESLAIETRRILASESVGCFGDKCIWRLINDSDQVYENTRPEMGELDELLQPAKIISAAAKYMRTGFMTRIRPNCCYTAGFPHCHEMLFAASAVANSAFCHSPFTGANDKNWFYRSLPRVASQTRQPQSIFRKTVAIWKDEIEKRSFWDLASFRLSHRVFQTCSVAKASPNPKNPRSKMATVFLQTLQAE